MIAFGPVTSRRLGLSLGINNIDSQKECSYGCVYCQIGTTPAKSLIRRSFYQPEQLAESVGEHLNKLDDAHKPDYLTFVTNGEPTIDINLGEEILLLKEFDIPVAVITNSSLLGNSKVRDDLKGADWVSVKIDTVDESVWRKINRPPEELKLSEVLEGIKIFASEYKGKLNTETMLVKGLNDNRELIGKNASFISELKPETAFLSVPIRPPAEKGTRPVSEEELTMAWQIYDSSEIKTELTVGFEGTDTGFTGNPTEDILSITAVHPLREDTMRELIKKENSGGFVVKVLLAQGLIKMVKHEGMTYYVRKYKNS